LYNWVLKNARIVVAASDARVKRGGLVAKVKDTLWGARIQ
jgi:hypothetical protein